MTPARRPLEEFDDGDDDAGDYTGLNEHRPVETRSECGDVGPQPHFEVVEVGLRRQAGLTGARRGGVGFRLLVLNIGRPERLRVGQSVEARIRVDGRHAAAMRPVAAVSQPDENLCSPARRVACRGAKG